MKLIIFTLGDKEYGIDISEVREVIRLRTITPIPETEEFVEGVISLRGKVIPLVNLRLKLGMEKSPALKSNRIIITQIDSHSVGVIVDSVLDVLTLDSVNITPPDEMLKEAEYLIGVAKIKERLIIVADICKLLRQDLTSQIEKMHQHIEVRQKQ